jgi:hypothetical protein
MQIRVLIAAVALLVGSPALSLDNLTGAPRSPFIALNPLLSDNPNSCYRIFLSLAPRRAKSASAGGPRTRRGRPRRDKTACWP